MTVLPEKNIRQVPMDEKGVIMRVSGSNLSRNPSSEYMRLSGSNNAGSLIKSTTP